MYQAPDDAAMTASGTQALRKRIERIEEAERERQIRLRREFCNRLKADTDCCQTDAGFDDAEFVESFQGSRKRVRREGS